MSNILYTQLIVWESMKHQFAYLFKNIRTFWSINLVEWYLNLEIKFVNKFLQLSSITNNDHMIQYSADEEPLLTSYSNVRIALKSNWAFSSSA